MKNLEQQLLFSIQKQKKSIARLQQIVWFILNNMMSLGY